MALTRVVSLRMFADTASAQAKLDAIEAEAKKLGELNPSIKPQIEKTAALRQMAVLRAELKAQGDKAGEDLGAAVSDGTRKGLGHAGRGGWIAAAVGLGAPLAGPLAAGGAAFSAFGALAAGSLAPVAKAMTGTGGLAAGWVTLDARQRTAAAGVEALKTRYDGLAKSMEPRVFQVFDSALSQANGLLGPLGKLAASSGAGIEHFLVQFGNDSGLRQFIGYAGSVAPRVIGLLGTDVTTLAHTVLTLAQAAGGAGLTELRLLTSGLQVLDKVVSVLPQPLEGAALGIGGIVLAMSKLGVLMPLLRLSGLAGALTAARTAMAATAVEADAAAVATAALGGAEVAVAAETGILAGAMAALDAVNPFAWAVLGAAALGGLAFWLSRSKTAADASVASIEAQNKAVGFNTSGYFSAAKAIGAANAQQEKQKITLTNVHTGVTGNTVALGSLTGATQTYTAAQQKLVTEGRNQDTFLGELESKYGLTRQAAISLAQHAGVLASQVDKGGRAMRDALGQTEAYANSSLRARRPVTQLAADMQDFANKTLTATDRTTALTSALKLFFDPANTADQDVITLKNDQVALAKALEASGGKTGLLTQKQRDARGAFDTYISQVAQAAQDAFTATGKTSSYTKVINDALPILERAAGHNQALRKQIQDLIDTEKRMKSERVSIKVSGQGSYSIVSGSIPGSGGRHYRASAGWRVPGFGGGDQHPALLEGGETVVDKDTSRVLAPVFRAAGVPGYSAGGVAGSYSGGLGGLNKWLISENSATVAAIAAAVAKAAVSAVAQGGAGFGGGMPGGGAPSANAALARRMFPQWASGANWAAWNYVAMRESGWNQFARNPSSGAYGIPQALPPTKLPFAGQAAGGSHPGPQIGWMAGYMGGRYGGPQGAAAHERAFSWYGDGLHATISSPTLIGVGERGPERVDVTPASQVRSGPLVQVNGMVVREQADLAILAQKLSFAVTCSGLG